MEQSSLNELTLIIREALEAGGAATEMRVRRFVSIVRKSNPAIANAIAPLLTAPRGLRFAHASDPIDSDSRQPLLSREDEIELATEPILAADIQTRLDGLIRERRSAEALMAEGLKPTRSLLMSGPPGVGKTLAARWLARELGVPLLTLDLATVISSFLGKTGSNIRSVLSHAQGFPCVLLLDEFDAIAKRRDDELDVGELKRLVTVLLQTIDEWPTTSLLVAATNHKELLDPALWRRFDLVLELGLPTTEERAKFLGREDIPHSLAQALAKVTEGQTLSALRRAVQSARKEAVLDKRPLEEAMVEALVRASPQDLCKPRRRNDPIDPIQRLRILRYHREGLAAREIAERVGLSHTTVNRKLREFNGGG